MKSIFAILSAAVTLVSAQSEYAIYCSGTTSLGEIPNCQTTLPPGNHVCPGSNIFCSNEQTCGFLNLHCVPAGRKQCLGDPFGLYTCPEDKQCIMNIDGSLGCVPFDADYSVPTDKPFLIQHRKTKDYITQSDFHYNNGNTYVLWSFHSKDYQSFVFTTDGGLESKHGKVCMQNGNPDGVDAGIAKMWPCVSPASVFQNFYYETTNKWIMEKFTGLCLTALDKGNNIYLRPCDPFNADQVFDLIF